MSSDVERRLNAMRASADPDVIATDVAVLVALCDAS
jgi:hypothetical protein